MTRAAQKLGVDKRWPPISRLRSEGEPILTRTCWMPSFGSWMWRSYRHLDAGEARWYTPLRERRARSGGYGTVAPNAGARLRRPMTRPIRHVTPLQYRRGMGPTTVGHASVDQRPLQGPESVP